MEFYNSEKLYRAVLPDGIYIKPDGSVTSAAFKDSKGLSVDREMCRENSKCISFMLGHIDKRYLNSGGRIVSITYSQIKDCDLLLKYCPLEDGSNDFHSEIHMSTSKIQLSSSKARLLANNCKIENEIS